LESSFCLTRASPFGDFTIIWQQTEAGPKVQRLCLPNTRPTLPGGSVTANLTPLSCPLVAGLAERIQRALEGEAITFELDTIAIGRCPEFQREVLLAEHRIPRGWVSTYGRLARHLGQPGAARAVGNALARNPFPIIIPCHRAIRANGELGGFQGGLAMKRGLLELEGVRFSPQGKVLLERVFY